MLNLNQSSSGFGTTSRSRSQSSERSGLEDLNLGVGIFLHRHGQDFLESQGLQGLNSGPAKHLEVWALLITSQAEQGVEEIVGPQLTPVASCLCPFLFPGHRNGALGWPGQWHASRKPQEMRWDLFFLSIEKPVSNGMSCLCMRTYSYMWVYLKI